MSTSRRNTLSDQATMAHDIEQRILVLAPTSKDSQFTCKTLGENGIRCLVCENLASLTQEAERGAGAVILAEELLRASITELVDTIARQPPWSDLPVILIAHQGADSPATRSAARRLGNVILLERPTRLTALVNAARNALRARERQYQTRDLIVARELTARALQESEARFRTLVEQVKDYAIFMIDLDGRATSWNEGVRKVLGFEENEFLGVDVTETIFTPQDLEQGIPQAELQDAAITGTAGNDRWMRRRDGSRFWASGVTTALRDSQGVHIGYTKVMRDLTPSKQAEEALKQADRRKDEFLATLAHELRNPLAPLQNSLNILQLTAGEDATARHLCETMERQVTHLVRLVDDLLEVSRITRGKIELRKGMVELASIVRNAVETSQPLIDAAGLQLSVALPEEPLVLHGDPVRLAQILSNLLNNASKYTNPGGKIWLHARREGDQALISVRDTGIGISPEALARIFDMFMQVDQGTHRSQGGLGIGLTLVRSLVEMHGGAVTAHSEGSGRGSEFIVSLPLAAGEPRSESAPLEGGASLLRSRRILVVDDNIDSANSLGMLLRVLGGDVRVAHDGRTALQTIKDYSPNVVLLDLGMPGMDGLEVARRVRKRPEFQDVTLVALTGWGQEDDRRRSREAGFDHHLVKPADLAALQSLLVGLD